MDPKPLEESWSSLAELFDTQVEERDRARAEAALRTPQGKSIRQVLISDTDGGPWVEEEAVFIDGLARTIGVYRRLVTSRQSPRGSVPFSDDRARGHVRSLLELLPAMPHTQGSCPVCGPDCTRPDVHDLARHVDDLRALLGTLDALRRPAPCRVPPELALVWGAADIVERLAAPDELRHLLRRQDGPLVHLARLAAWAAGDFGDYPALTYEAQIRAVVRHRRASAAHPTRRRAPAGSAQPFAVRLPQPEPVALPALIGMDRVSSGAPDGTTGPVEKDSLHRPVH